MSTTLSRAPTRVRHELRRRLLQVKRVESPTPRLRRIVLAGPELEGFTSAAADDHVKLFFPGPSADARPAMRDYTPRRYDAAAGELTIEFVLHETGPASDWAAQATPGQTLAVGGPRGSLLIPDSYDAYLLIGDETALPAIARRLEEMRPGIQATVLIEVADEAEQLHLPTAANAAITWLPRRGRPAGDPALLLEALGATRLPPGPDLHAWIAAEIEVARALRIHLIEARGLARSDIRAAGYWRIGAEGEHGRLDD